MTESVAAADEVVNAFPWSSSPTLRWRAAVASDDARGSTCIFCAPAVGSLDPKYVACAKAIPPAASIALRPRVPVRAHTGKDHADGLPTVDVRERLEERVDGHVRNARRHSRHELQQAIFEDQASRHRNLRAKPGADANLARRRSVGRIIPINPRALPGSRFAPSDAPYGCS